MKKEYKPNVYKFIVKPFYPNFALFSKPAGDDTADWEMLQNGMVNRDKIKQIIHEEIDKMFDEYEWSKKK